MDWTWKGVAGGAVIVVGVVLAVGILAWATLRGTEADRHARIEHSRACTTISDQALRTLCLRDHG